MKQKGWLNQISVPIPIANPKIIDHNALGRDAIVGLHVVEGPFLEQYLMWILIGVYRYDGEARLVMLWVR